MAPTGYSQSWPLAPFRILLPHPRPPDVRGRFVELQAVLSSTSTGPLGQQIWVSVPFSNPPPPSQWQTAGEDLSAGELPLPAPRARSAGPQLCVIISRLGEGMETDPSASDYLEKLIQSSSDGALLYSPASLLPNLGLQVARLTQRETD